MTSARNAGVICITAAGNETTDTDVLPAWPACYELDNIANVGMTGRNDSFFDWNISNRDATTVDLAAPGHQLVSTSHESDDAYRYATGTSLSAPLVSGTLALLKARFSGDSYLQTINRLLASTDRLPQLEDLCQTGGRLNISNALSTTSSRPANDDFDRAFYFAANPAAPSTASVANNVGSTAEAGEPAHAGQTAGKSIWWKWTPNSTFLPQPRNVTITTGGSTVPTVIGVYAGSSVSTLSTIVLSSDGVVTFSAQAGTTYRIAVDGKNGASGTVRLAIIKDLNRNLADFDANGRQDIIYQDASGYLAVWFMDGANAIGYGYLTPQSAGAGWKAFGSGDFNRDGKPDLAFQHDNGALAAWYMDGANLTASYLLNPQYPGDAGWRAICTGDFDRDNNLDIVFQHNDGSLAVWFMEGIILRSSSLFNPGHPGDAKWKIVGAGDFNSDGKIDLAFQHTDGTLAAWYHDGILMTGATLLSPWHPGDSQWRVAGVNDQNGDGKADLLFQHSGSGDVALWFMNGVTLSSSQFLNPSNPGGTWKIAAP